PAYLNAQPTNATVTAAIRPFPTRRSSDLRQLQRPSDQRPVALVVGMHRDGNVAEHRFGARRRDDEAFAAVAGGITDRPQRAVLLDRKSTRLNSSHVKISYAVFCLKKKKQQ